MYYVTTWLTKNSITHTAQYLTENETGRPVPDLFLFFKKAIFEVNASGLQLSFNQFR